MILSGTGHRPDKLGGYGFEQHDKLVKFLSKRLLDIQPTKVISGMALGFDQALAQAAINACIPFTAAVPFLGQERMWERAAKLSWQKLIDQADEVKIVCMGFYAPYKMQARNEWMVNNSDAVLALWNGTGGGTANCVAYARMIEKKIINCWPEWMEFNK